VHKISFSHAHIEALCMLVYVCMCVRVHTHTYSISLPLCILRNEWMLNMSSYFIDVKNFGVEMNFKFMKVSLLAECVA
jgi:6-pyruvoyl-tetrahydropterin synthase